MRARLRRQTPITHWRPSPVRRMLRHPTVYWAAALALATWSAIAVASIAAPLDDDTVTVWLTTEPVGAGADLSAHVMFLEVEARLAPTDRIETIGPDERSARAIGANEIVTTADVATPSTLHASEAAVAVPTSVATPVVSAGQPVFVVVHADPFSGVDAALVQGRVLTADDDSIVVAIDQADLAPVAAALGGGVVTLALAP